MLTAMTVETVGTTGIYVANKRHQQENKELVND